MARDGVEGFHDEALPERDFVAQAFVGFRSWRVMDGLLRSVSYDYAWAQGVNTASCMTNQTKYVCEHTDWKQHTAECRAPATCSGMVRECGCGFWAYGSDRQWFTSGGATFGVHCNSLFILGMVWGWGRMVVGELGFRAEHATIAALLMPPQVSLKTGLAPGQAEDVEAALAEHYWSVPVYRSRDALFAALPPTPTAPLVSLTEDGAA